MLVEDPDYISANLADTQSPTK